jgi:pyridoxal phosphate enzyme (YggS family)
MTLAAAVETIRKTIEKTAKNRLLSTDSVTLLAASKGQSAARIEEAIALGVAVFGENKVQEAAEKWPAIKQRHQNVALHLIGPLQTNKVKDALALFDVIQTLDRPSLANSLAKELKNWGNEELKKKESSIPQFFNSSIPTFYIQINTGEEPQKAGVLPKDADAFIEDCVTGLKLPVVGLMCVPPADQPPAPHFALLRTIALRHGLRELSMGMSGDYETAIRMGSTCVRVGTALFGERKRELEK